MNKSTLRIMVACSLLLSFALMLQGCGGDGGDKGADKGGDGGDKGADKSGEFSATKECKKVAKLQLTCRPATFNYHATADYSTLKASCKLFSDDVKALVKRENPLAKDAPTYDVSCDASNLLTIDIAGPNPASLTCSRAGLDKYFAKLSEEECEGFASYEEVSGGHKKFVATGSADQIVDDAMRSVAFPKVRSPKGTGMAIPANIFYMALGGLIVAMAAMVLHFVKAKRSTVRETSVQARSMSTVELRASAIDA